MQYSVEDDVALKPYEDARTVLDEVIESIRQNLKKGGTAGDLARLLTARIDVQHHLDANNIKEIKCTWIDPEMSTGE